MFWIASRPEMIGRWFKTEEGATLSHCGCWWATVPQSEWPEHQRPAIEAVWQEPYGDRRQEFVVFGRGIDRDKITQVFEQALLTPEEDLPREGFWGAPVEL